MKRNSHHAYGKGSRIMLMAAALLAVGCFILGAWYFSGGFQPTTALASAAPTATAAVTAAPTAASTAKATPTTAPTAAPTALPTLTPQPTAEATAEPTPSPTPTPTPEPTPEPTPVPPLYGKIIGIDPGHQEKANLDREPVSPGSSDTKYKVTGGTQGVVTGMPEYEVVLQVALGLREALKAQGAQVYMTRETNDVDVSNIERAQMMNELSADVVLRLHCNAWTDESLHGIGAFVKSQGDGAQESQDIAQYVLDAMGQATGARVESIHISDTYSGLNWSTVPSILLEMGYMTNPQEDRLLCSGEYQALLIEGMVKGLVNYYTAETGD